MGDAPDAGTHRVIDETLATVEAIEAIDETPVRRAFAEAFDLELDSKRQRTRAIAYGEIHCLARQFDLDDPATTDARALFEQAQEANLIAGRGRHPIVTAVVYAAMRCREVPITIAEVAATAAIDEDAVRNAYRALNRELGLPTPPPDPSMYVARLADEVDLGSRVQTRAREIIKAFEEANPSHAKNPAGLAAACLYTAAQEFNVGVSQRDFAPPAGVSAPTVGRLYRDVTIDVDDAGLDDS